MFQLLNVESISKYFIHYSVSTYFAVVVYCHQCLSMLPCNVRCFDNKIVLETRITETRMGNLLSNRDNENESVSVRVCL